MSKTAFLAVMATALMFPGVMQAQEHHTKSLPSDVIEVRLENYVMLRVVQGNDDHFAYSGQLNENTTNAAKGSRVVLDNPDSDVTLYLKPGRSMTFNTRDFSALTLIGDFAPFDSLVLHAEDYSHIAYNGSEGDTLRVRRVVNRGEDYSRITAAQPVQYGVGWWEARGWSRIDLAATDMRGEMAPGGVGAEVFSDSGYGRVNPGRHTVDGELKAEREEYARDEALEVVDRVSSGMGDLTRKARGKMERRPWKAEVDLALGWHNWGAKVGGGFGGVEGVSAVGTDFHNVQMAVNIPIINVRGFALKAGLGVEWDRYSFRTPEVYFDRGADPMTFAAGNTGNAVVSSRLKTRSIVVPVKMEFGARRGWRLSVTALPGLDWSGSGTGLRRCYDMADAGGTGTTRKEKDYAVGRYMNPYRLDVRVAVQYKVVGLYVQGAAVPLLKEGCQELYPVKFGIIF